MRFRASILALCLTLLPSAICLAQGLPNDLPSAGPVQVGEVVEASYETPHPYSGAGAVGFALVSKQEIHLSGATYVAPYFSRFELAPGDYVIVRSPDSRRSWRYERFGKGELGKTGGFWGIHIPGDRLVIELYSRGLNHGFGYAIDRVARGFAGGFPVDPEAICGVDDMDWAQCYENTESRIYQESRAVARLLISGTALCTGWLVGDQGHLLTNNHCISSQAAASNTNFEFMAEGACGEVCGQLQCPGTIVTTMSTLIQTNPAFDYSLLLLDTNPTPTYGFLQLRETGPEIDERIYIPQHPGGQGKRIAVESTDPNDASGFGEIDQIFPLGAGLLASYYADTTGGSSGSPIIGYEDHCVVALHQGTLGCAAQGNVGNVIDQIITDLGANLPSNAICSGDEIFTDGFESGDATAW